MLIDYSKLPQCINDIFYPLLFYIKRFLILVGGRGSGKSRWAAQKIIWRLTTEKPHKIACFRKVARTIKNSVFEELKTVIIDWGLWDQFKINKTEKEFEFIPNGNKIICVGLDNRDKLRSLSGVTSIWIEEATELSREDFEEINLILRGHHTNYLQIIVSFNPIDVYHWIKKRLVDKKADNIKVVNTTHLDNRFIDEEYRGELEELKNIDRNLYNVYAKGLWGQLKNLIYTKYKIESFAYYNMRFDHELYSLDFGFTNPCCLLHLGFVGNQVYVTELLYETHLTNNDLIELLNKEHIPRYLSNGAPNRRRGLKMYADAEDPKAIETIKRAGFNIEKCYKAPGSVVEGIKKVIEKDLILEEFSVNVINEIRAYKRKEDPKTGQVFEKPVEINDHAMKCLAYGIYTKELKPGPGNWKDVKGVKRERTGAY